MIFILSSIIACSGVSDPPAEVAPTQEVAPVAQEQAPEVAPAAEAAPVAPATEPAATTTTTQQ